MWLLLGIYIWRKPGHLSYLFSGLKKEIKEYGELYRPIIGLKTFQLWVEDDAIVAHLFLADLVINFFVNYQFVRGFYQSFFPSFFINFFLEIAHCVIELVEAKDRFYLYRFDEMIKEKIIKSKQRNTN